MLSIKFIFVFLLSIVRFDSIRSAADFGIDEHSSHMQSYASSGLKSFRAKCMEVQDEERFDCHPDTPSSESECISRGCCWMPARNPSHATQGYPPIGVPYCFFPQSYTGYSIYQVEHSEHMDILHLKRMIASGFVNEVPNVKVEVIKVNRQQVRVRVVSASKRRFEVPIRMNVTYQNQFVDALYEYEIKKGVLSIRRTASGRVVWSANLNTLIFSDQMIQINTKISSDVVYGLGEHKDDFRKTLHSWKKYTFFNWDQSPSYNSPLYGSHAVYVAIERNASNSAALHAHSVFLLNSNAMEAILQPTNAITWRTIGGILDFFINLGPSIDEAIEQHVSLVGRPQMPPYWSLGYQLCRFGYQTLAKTREVVDRMIKSGIPYDVQWHDIDFMKDYNVFTYDKETFDGLPEFIDELHSKNIKYIPMFDPGLGGNHTEEEYPIFYEALKEDVFIKNATGEILRTSVWNKYWTAWLDFTNPKAVNFWVKQFRRFHREIPFDGAWIDMNEPSSVYDGSMDGCPWESRFETPQYAPGAISPLAKHTACMTAQHHLGLHYDLHNLYGYFEAIATDKALKSLNKRPFVISRATFAGQGKYSGHWTGDILSTWEDMKMSINNMLNFNLFGIPMVGADICGFIGNTTVELCARWQQLGAFYPFSRNHNIDSTNDQDPPILGEQVVEATLYSLRIRYTLLPLLYTEFYKSHVYGSLVVRSLALEFPLDLESEKIDNQFLWGHSIMIAPVLEAGVRELNVYYPPGKWYRFNTLEVLADTPLNKLTGVRSSIRVPLTEIVVAVRGGSVLATQAPEVNTALSRQNPFRLLITLDERQSATGDLYWDDGEVIDPVLTGEYNYVSFHFEQSALRSQVHSNGFEGQPKLSTIEIVGFERMPKSVTFKKQLISVYQDLKRNLIRIEQLEIDLNEVFEMQFNYI